MFVTHEVVLERLEGNDCGLSLEEDSDSKEDGIYGYMAEANTVLSLAALCSKGVLGAEEEDNLDSNSDATSPFLVPGDTIVPEFGMELFQPLTTVHAKLPIVVSIKRFIKRNLAHVGMVQCMNALADKVQK